ncbi:unnamed protein product [Heligmosomoides polygyrus]|uniref:TetR family transcriptional regulator n=1 Tax=Heligmosomoides polygyrus TaxID=6339 RepID=A0A183FC42_HELPZ|nr:unnamed protein product [Heligmosomoides polygyrus]
MEKVARERATAALEPSANGEQHETPVMVR